jgi:hypothetical protein
MVRRHSRVGLTGCASPHAQCRVEGSPPPPSIALTSSLASFLQPFIKLVKNKSYYKRYQVKYRRRRGE